MKTVLISKTCCCSDSRNTALNKHCPVLKEQSKGGKTVITQLLFLIKIFKSHDNIQVGPNVV